jgi:aspartyl-tRNA(Asn)/glutamyl-tRNA(Gln) amidotransferase subunit A
MKPPSCRDRVEQALARIADPNGEGARACLTVYADAARAAADAADARAVRGESLGPLDGTIVSIKDLFDVAGEPTRAGSRILAEEAAPAGGRGHRRQNQYERIRLFRNRRQSAFRHAR